MSHPAIPAPSGAAPEVARVLYPIKETLDRITGVTTSEIQTLSATATLADVVSKVNEIINRLNRNGT